MASDRQFHSLEDFLTSNMLHVDGTLDTGWNASFSVKGREIEATVLFADVTAFSTRTLSMSAAATLVYVQNYFAWITEEALRDRPGIVDKYIGDEIMVIFAEEFGSKDPFVDAVQAAAAMSRYDVHAYSPHVGIASGDVIVGYAGTSLRYNASVFGAPVALAARCCAVKPEPDTYVSSTIVMPAADWGDRDLDDVLPRGDDEPKRFELRDARDVEMKGLGPVAVREIHNTGMWMPMNSAEDRAVESLQALEDANRYWPRRSTTAPGE